MSLLLFLLYEILFVFAIFNYYKLKNLWDSNFSNSRYEKSQNISNSYYVCLKVTTKKYSFCLFCAFAPLDLDKIMVDRLISVTLSLWNRLRISEKFFTFLVGFELSRTKTFFA